MNTKRFAKSLSIFAFVIGLVAAGYLLRGTWLPQKLGDVNEASARPDEVTALTGKIIVGEQAQSN